MSVPSPWSPEFHTTNTKKKIEPDEIQHYGNRNSGRYRRGSGKNPRSGGARQKPTKAQTSFQNNVVKSAISNGSISRSRSIDEPHTEAGTGKTVYPKKWSNGQIFDHMVKLQDAEHERRQKKYEEFKKKHNIPVEDASGPASKEEIRNAEKEVGVPFSKEYKSILSHHGILSTRSGSSHEMMGIVPGKPDSNLNTAKATKWERDNDPKAPKDAYVVENTGWDGLIIWQKTDGTVHGRFRNEPELTKVSDSLAEWLNT